MNQKHNRFRANMSKEQMDQLQATEIKSKRTRFGKVFALGANRFQAVTYTDPVHRFNPDTQEWDEIDNRFTETESMKNARESWKQGKMPRIAVNDPLLSCETGVMTTTCGVSGNSPFIRIRNEQGNTLSWGIEGATSILPEIEQDEDAVAEEAAAAQAEQRPTVRSLREKVLNHLQGNAIYRDIFPGVDLRCKLGHSFKDELIFEAPECVRNVTFLLSAPGCTMQMNEGNVVLIENANGETVFRLPAPFLLDADEQRGEVTVSLTQRSEGEYALTYVPDAAFVQDASFPLVLDPAVESGTGETAIEDTYVKEGSTTNNSSGDQVWICNNTTYGKRYGYMRVVELPPIGSNHFITGAYLNLKNYSAPTSETPLMCSEVLGDWELDKLTFANQPAINPLYQDYCKFPASKYTWQQLDVTTLARKWYLGDNKGVVLTPRTENPNTVRIQSSNGSAKPYLTVNYASLAGLESYLTYDSQSAGLAGTGSVSLVNGNLIFAHADTSMNGNRLPVSVTHYYNSCDADTNEFGLGNGWRTSLHQTLHKEYINEEVLYVYTDGDGTEHWFEPDEDTDAPDGQYKDMSGLSLTLNTETLTEDDVTETYLVITDKGNNRMLFPEITETCDASNSITGKELIRKIKDAVGNTVKITPVSVLPDDPLRLFVSSVTDGAGRVTAFTYSNNLCAAILTPWQDASSCTRFSYTGTTLTGITHEDGRTAAYTYADHDGYSLLVSTSATDGASVTYTYSNTGAVGGLPHCITHALVTGTKDGTTLKAADVTYSYGNHLTLVTDNISGKTLRYHFNDNGNQTSIDDGLGYAIYTEYDQSDDNTNTPINHATTRSRMQRAVKNMLLDHMMDANSSVWEKSSTGTFTRDQANTQWGPVSYKILVPTNGEAYIRQAVTLIPGKPYTLSGYMRSGAPKAFVRVAYTINGVTSYFNSDVVPVSENVSDAPFQRVFVSFTLPANASASVYCEAVGMTSYGYFWIDCMQLEEGLTCNHFNMLQNSDFTHQSSSSTIPTGWTLGDGDSSYISMKDLSEADDVDGKLAPEFLRTFKAARLAGRYNRNITLEQDFRCYGNAGDRFTAGGWCKSFAKKMDEAGYVFCSLSVYFTGGSTWYLGGRVNFNYGEDGWQFASGSIVAPYNFTKVRFSLYMNRQMNHADFTGLYLYPEAFGTDYVYDKKGNRKKARQMYGGTHETEYDDFNNVIEYTQPGRSLATTNFYGETEDEQKKHLLLKSISPLGTVSTATYDAYGNPLTAQVQDSEAGTGSFIHTETAYTPQDEQTQQHEGNYVISQTDARGKSVATVTDLNKGTTTSVTDPKGQTVNYTYDSLRRIVKTSTAAGNKEYKNEYSYDENKGHLIEVRHNTDSTAANDVVYTFEQDALGRQVGVKVGTQTLSTSTYQNDPTQPNYGTLSQTTFGNGHRVRQQYDDFNRVTGVIHGDETAPRYEYAYNAKGQVAHVKDNQLNRTAESEYDLADRPRRVKTHEGSAHVYTGEVVYDDLFGNLSEFHEMVGADHTAYATTFGYDEENRPTALNYKSGSTTVGSSGSTFDKLGRTTASTVKVGSRTYTSQYQFAAGGHGTNSTTGLVSSITQTGGNCAYTYDDNGNIATATVNGKVAAYTYDALGQLIQVDDQSDTTSGANGTTWVYTYDQGGNILKKERFAYGSTATALETMNYVYGDPNWRDKVTSIGGKAISYDAIGNPLNDGTWTYTWQNGRQLASMTNGTTTASFVYNADGLRVQKTVNGVVTNYTLHGKNVVHMTQGSNDLHFFYDAQNKPAVVVYNGTAYAYAKNLQGDIIAILDQSGNVVVQYTYDAWGKPLSTTGSMASTLGIINPFRYRSYVYDQETELYYLRNRYFSFIWSRFVSPDLVENVLVSTTSVMCNLYCYCANSPANLLDSEGTWPWDAIVKGITAAVVVVAVVAACAVTAGAAAVAIGATASAATAVATVTAGAGLVAGGAAIVNEAVTNPTGEWDYWQIAIDSFYGSAHGFVDAMTMGKGRLLFATCKIAIAGCWAASDSIHREEPVNQVIEHASGAMVTASLIQGGLATISNLVPGTKPSSLAPVYYGQKMITSPLIRLGSGFWKYREDLVDAVLD